MRQSLSFPSHRNEWSIQAEVTRNLKDYDENKTSVASFQKSRCGLLNVVHQKMKLSISDKHVRKAVYRAYKGQCFFTGRSVREDEMVIDHLIPRAQGGKDSFENYVLTFGDLNAGKSSKLDDELKRMTWTVKSIYAPRAKKLYESFSQKICSDFFISVDDEEVEFNISKFKTRVKPPENLVHIKNENLFWVKDNKIDIYTTLQNLNSDKAFYAIRGIESYVDDAFKSNLDYCNSAFMTDEQSNDIKSIWFCVEGSYFKAVKKVEYYETDADYHWANIFFTKQYMSFCIWHRSTTDLMSAIFEIEDQEKYEKALKLFERLYPQPIR